MEAIDRYLNKEMGEEERIDFERRLANDPELAVQLAWQQKVVASLSDREALAFWSQLRRVRATREQAVPNPPFPQTQVLRNRRLWFGVVLLVALALGTYGAYRVWHAHPTTPIPPLKTVGPVAQVPPRRNEQTTPEKQVMPPHPVNQRKALALQYYQSPVDLSPSGSKLGMDSSLLNLMQHSKSQYAEACQVQKRNPALAAKLFKAVADTLANPPNEVKIMATYLRGHAFFNLKNYRQAAKDFEMVAQKGKKDALPATWFQALALLSMDAPMEQLLPLLAKVSKEPGQYQQEAKALQLKIQAR